MPQDLCLHLESFTSDVEILYFAALFIVICLIAQYRLMWRDFPLATQGVACEDAEADKKEVNTSKKNGWDNEGTGVSIVMPVEEDDGSLKENLLSLLSQTCETRHEVIVVDEHPGGTVAELVKSLQKDDGRLRYTYVPTSARFIELRKLSLTLGIRAARASWVIIVSSTTRPKERGWLKNFCSHLSPDYDFVSAYVNYNDDGTSQARRCIYERLQAQLLRMRAYKCCFLLGTEPTNYAIRKEWFMENEGFADSLFLPMGEESILVNRHAEPERSLLLLDSGTAATEELPERRTQRKLRIGREAVATHLRGGATLFRWRNAWAHVFFELFVLSSPIYAALRILKDWPSRHYSTEAAIPDGLVSVSVIAFLMLPPLLLMKSTKRLEERAFCFYIYVNAALHPFRKLLSHSSCQKMAKQTHKRAIDYDINAESAS